MLYFLFVYAFKFPMSLLESKKWFSDLIYGAHDEILRNSTIVTFFVFIYLGLLFFYSIQTFMYIFAGPALNGKNTGIIRFFGMCISTFIEFCQNPFDFFASSGSTSNIERTLQYRDAKMCNMTNEQAVNFMRGTGNIEYMMSRPDLKQHSRVLNYMDSKMASMDNETALNFIKNQK